MIVLVWILYLSLVMISPPNLLVNVIYSTVGVEYNLPIARKMESTPRKGNDKGSDLAVRCSPRLNSGATTRVAATFDQENEIFPGMAFATESDLMAYMNRIGLQNGFVVSKSCEYYPCESKDEIQKVTDRFPIGSWSATVSNTGKPKGPVYRGKFICNAKGRCVWCVRFTHARTEGGYRYIVKSEGLNLTHSQHPMVDVRTGNNEKSFLNVGKKHSEKQITTEENKHIAFLACYTSDNTTKIRTAMENKFSGTSYEYNVLSRIVKKHRDCHFGLGRDKMSHLIQLGIDEVKRGGTFVHELDDCLRLQSFILQTREMKLYTDVYNDFVILDGTHGTNRYGLILEPPVIVDCLGRSVIAGIPICESEESRFSQKILESLNLVRKGGVLMTDEGSGFNGIAGQLGMHHLLCSFHFQNKAKSVKGICDKFKKQFLAGFNSLIYEDFQCAEKFQTSYDKLVDTMKEKCPNAKEALNLLSGLYRARHKVAVTFTKSLFSCGHTSSGRSESLNSVIKGHGTLKQEMKGYGLFQLVEHLLSIFQRMQNDSLKEIKEIITKSHGDSSVMCSDYVKKIWSENILACNNWSEMKQDNDENVDSFQSWTVQNSELKLTSTVTLYKDGYPTCTCGKYLSTLIPCPCICAVFMRNGKQPFKLNDLPRRWRLDQHPLWNVAYEKLGITPPQPEGAANAVNINSCTNHVNVNIQVSSKAFGEIKFPKTETARYAALKRAFEAIASYAKHNPALYKHFLALLLKEAVYCREASDAASGTITTDEKIATVATNEWAASSALPLNNETDNDESDNDDVPLSQLVPKVPVVPLPPLLKQQRKRARVTNADVANHSTLTIKKK